MGAYITRRTLDVKIIQGQTGGRFIPRPLIRCEAPSYGKVETSLATTHDTHSCLNRIVICPIYLIRSYNGWLTGCITIYPLTQE